MEEDLDEGYSYNQNLSRPEHTPEVSKSNLRNSPKKDLSQSISKKLEKIKYQTQKNKPGPQKSGFSPSSSKSPKKRLGSYQSTTRDHKQNFSSRMKKYESQKQLKMTQRLEEKNKKILEECTFRPKLRGNKSLGRIHDRASSTNSQKHRNITEFLKDQSDYEQKKLEKLSHITYSKEKCKSTTFKPKISKRSQYITKSLQDSIYSVPVYKRLHNLSKKEGRNTPSDLGVGIVQGSTARAPHKSLALTRNKLQKDNYITENFDIAKMFEESSKRSKSKETKRRQKVHDQLYEDAGKRKSRQEQRENQHFQMYKNQSVRSFLKNSHSFLNKGSHRGNNKKISSGDKAKRKTNRVSKGYLKPKNPSKGGSRLQKSISNGNLSRDLENSRTQKSIICK